MEGEQRGSLPCTQARLILGCMPTKKCLKLARFFHSRSDWPVPTSRLQTSPSTCHFTVRVFQAQRSRNLGHKAKSACIRPSWVQHVFPTFVGVPFRTKIAGRRKFDVVAASSTLRICGTQAPSQLHKKVADEPDLQISGSMIQLSNMAPPALCMEYSIGLYGFAAGWGSNCLGCGSGVSLAAS